MPSAALSHLLATLLREHGSVLQLFAAQWTDSPEDAVQEAFLALARQTEWPQHVVPWLFQVVRNQAINEVRQSQLRRRSERKKASELSDWFEMTPEVPVDAQIAAASLAELEDEIREIIVAHLWGGLTFEEVAEVVGVSSSTAHRRYVAGLQTLRERLQIHVTE